MANILSKLLTVGEGRQLRKYEGLVARINELEPGAASLTDPELAARTPEFKQRVAGGEKLDEILAEAFATVREAGKRALGMRHFDVQLIGGMVLNDGQIAEMKTGEGKTLVATLPAYLNALTGNDLAVCLYGYGDPSCPYLDSKVDGMNVTYTCLTKPPGGTGGAAISTQGKLVTIGPRGVFDPTFSQANIALDWSQVSGPKDSGSPTPRLPRSASAAMTSADCFPV